MKKKEESINHGHILFNGKKNNLNYLKEILIMLLRKAGTATTLASLILCWGKKQGIGRILTNLSHDYYITTFYKEENLQRILQQGP
ncbi:hypothetical protein H5410_021735 [Solanum commersonii]|uniref:Uncharacterized protein n=1 Tax=Solanum commersonii TaxID=4109 RepID=A0A9J5ZI17_SOLCO|nr:hypothetical protein H5410_021735 [Solanum commersonii]